MAAKKKKKAAAPKKKKSVSKKKSAPKKKKVTKARKASAPKKSSAKKSSAKKKRAPKTGRSRVAETILQAVTITVIADGEFASEEEALLRRLAAEPLFHEVEDVTKVVKSAVDLCIKQGLDGALAQLAKQLPTEVERETAFATCLAAAAADGKITGTEARLLQALREAFEIDDDRVRELAGPIAEIFD